MVKNCSTGKYSCGLKSQFVNFVTILPQSIPAPDSMERARVITEQDELSSPRNGERNENNQPCRLNKGLRSNFLKVYSDQQIPAEGRGTKVQKRCNNNNEDGDISLNVKNDNFSSQKLFFSFFLYHTLSVFTIDCCILECQKFSDSKLQVENSNEGWRRQK